jgi:predicted Zn finger-like uncharacterized protein
MDLGEGMGPGANPGYKAFLVFPMATLIICPVCETRYETQAVFPPEGRKVRCSKCAHVWQALPVTAPVEPAPPMAPFPQPAAPPPPPPPQPAQAVKMAMRGFAGIAPGAPPPPPGPGFTPGGTDADLAAQVAQINAEAMAEAPVAAPEAEKRGGGIFARLSRKAAPAPSAPPVDASMDEGAMADATMADATMGDAGMGDATMTEFGMGDAELGIDPALAAQAFPEEAPRKKPNIVTIGWLVLALIVASVIGTLVLAPSAVMSVLPGAARLYALFGAPVGSEGLAFEGVRYGWTGEGGQTVLEVQGDVVNLTSSTVDVPTVVIALRDEKGEEISEWTTEIGEEELKAGEHAPFLRQIPAPPSNVRSVKVRFAKAE